MSTFSLATRQSNAASSAWVQASGQPSAPTIASIVAKAFPSRRLFTWIEVSYEFEAVFVTNQFDRLLTRIVNGNASSGDEEILATTRCSELPICK